MSSEPEPSFAPCPLDALVAALPLAAARLVVAERGQKLRIGSCNEAWRALWVGLEPDLSKDGGALDLAALETVLVDPGDARLLHGCIADGLGFAKALAVDRQGPDLLDAWGCAGADGYLLMLQPCREPDRVALEWPKDGRKSGNGRGFRYLAGLALDGSWQIRASLPDHRQVLGLEIDAAKGWLAHADPGDGRALRSRHLALLAGRAQRTSYRLGVDTARSLLLDDAAEPLCHPISGEVIGIIGEVRLVDEDKCPQATRGEPHGFVNIVKAIEALGSPAALFDPMGRLEAAGDDAMALLDGSLDDRQDGTALGTLLGTDQAVAERLLGSLDADRLDDATTGAGLDLPLPLGDGAERDDGHREGRLRARLRSLTLDDGRHVLVTLARDNAVDHRVRDALYFDSATGLPNRFLFLDRLRQTLARNAASGGSFAVLVIEIERLSLVERSFGRPVAEALAVSLGDRFMRSQKELTTAARLDDAHFGVIADELGGIEDAARIAQALLDQLHAPVTVSGREIGVAARIGIAFYPHDGSDAEMLIGLAQAAVDRLPHSQDAAYQFYTSEMNTASLDRLMLEQQLTHAIAEEQFVLVYQPQISFATSRIVGMEALIRWRHPELGMMPPAEFIPLAEETGAIVAIGEWVVEAACRELVGWFAAGITPLRLAINVSGRQYNDANLVPGIERILEATGFPPRLLELELTESVIMEDVVDAAKRLGDLHRLGINLAVDDFGTGYSSLSYLKRFPIHSLKLDRSFVRDIAHDESSASIARAIIAFGSALGLKVIAEGVESHDQYDILRAAGCDELQGYLFSRPVPPDDAKRLAGERRHLGSMRP